MVFTELKSFISMVSSVKLNTSFRGAAMPVAEADEARPEDKKIDKDGNPFSKKNYLHQES